MVREHPAQGQGFTQSRYALQSGLRLQADSLQAPPKFLFKQSSQAVETSPPLHAALHADLHVPEHAQFDTSVPKESYPKECRLIQQSTH